MAKEKATPPPEEVPPAPDPTPEVPESELILQFHWKDLPAGDQRVGKALNELVEALWAQLPARTGRRKFIEHLIEFRAAVLKPAPPATAPAEADPSDKV